MDSPRAWHAHPWLARAVRVLIFLVPIALSIVAAHVVAQILPAPQPLLLRLGWFALLAATGTGVIYVAEQALRRFSPLSTLFKLSLVFPDRAPARFSLALRTGTTRQLARQLENAQRNGLGSTPQEAAEHLLVLVAALNEHDRLTRGHCERVRAYTDLIATEMGLSDEDRSKLHWAGMLHDIGKLEVPGEILNKPGELTAEEIRVVQRHPAAGARLAAPMREWLGPWFHAIDHHHEHWDGNGYPYGLAGDAIPLAGRIVAVADVYDVITATRSYKKAQSAEDGRAELARCAGTQFDPTVVRAFLGISLGRMRLMLGPLTWLNELPGLGRVPLAQAGTAVSAIAAGATVLLGGLIPTAPTPDITVLAAPSAVVEVVDSPAAEPVSTPPAPAAPVVPAPTPTPEPLAPAPVEVAPAPVLVADIATIDEDTPAMLAVLANDSGDHLTLTGVSQPAEATVTIDQGHLVITPARDFDGEIHFSYTAETALHASGTGAVTVDVRPVNDPPSFAVGANPVGTEDQGPVSVAGWATAIAPGPANETTQTVAFTVTADDPSLFGVSPTVSPQGDLTYSSAPDANGTTTIHVTADDGNGGTATHDATLSVTPVNDPPSFAVGAGPVAAEDQGPMAVAGWATAIAPGPLDESAQNVTFTTSADDPTLFSAPPAVSPTGDLTYTSAPDANGTTTIHLVADDGIGGTVTHDFTVTVTPVNDAPSPGSDDFLVNDGNPLAIPVTMLLANDADHDGDALTVTGVNTSLTAGAVTFDGTTLTYDPGAFSGTDYVAYIVSDGITTALGSIVITVDTLVQPTTLYFQSGVSTANEWALSAIMPIITGAPDLGGDGNPGLTIKKGNGQRSESDSLRYQDFVYVPGQSLQLGGPVNVDVWGTAADFDPNDDVHFYAYLDRCDIGGANCVSLLNADIHVNNWNGGSTSLVRRSLNLGTVNATLTASEELRLKVLVGHHDLWLVISGDYPTNLVLPKIGP